MSYRIIRSQNPIEVRTGYGKSAAPWRCPALRVVEPDAFDDEAAAYKTIVERFNSGEYLAGPSGLEHSEAGYHMKGAGNVQFDVEEVGADNTCLCVEIINKYDDYYNDEYYATGNEQFIFGPFETEEARADFISQFAQHHYYGEDEDEEGEGTPEPYWPKGEALGYDRVVGIRAVERPILGGAGSYVSPPASR